MLKIYKTVVGFFVAIRDGFIDCIDRGVKGCILKYRKSTLIVAAAIGYVFANYACDIVSFCTPEKPVLESSITILALGLPTFFILWLFRTHDTQENINNSTFFECARMLATKDSIEDSDGNLIKESLPQKIALEQLAYLKRETSFDKKKIDLLTRNLFLMRKDLSYAQLSGIDLSGVNLKQAILIQADLSNADLKLADLTGGIDLTGADLHGADLRGADLHGADLKPADLGYSDFSNLADLSNADLRAANLTQAKLDDAKLEGTIYNDMTAFEGTWLDNKEARYKAGMIYQPNEGDTQNKSGSDG